MRWRADTEVRVPAPVAARDGSLVVEATADGLDGSRMCAVFHWLDGEPLIDHLTEPNLAAAGEAAARLHEHARTFPIPSGLADLGHALPVRGTDRAVR